MTATARRGLPFMLASLCLLAVSVSAPASALARAHDHVPTAGRPPDSGAPPGAPPHYIPNEPWVAYHWLPFDETRLQRLLRTDRSGLCRWLRDDTQTLAMLGHERGWPIPSSSRPPS